MTRKFVYALEAQAELREILRYTAKEWGEALTGLRVKAAGSHFVFCVLRPGKPALVLAILHQRMDLMARLKIRLK